MKLRLAISTCPNDTFMFDALIHGRVDTEGLDFELTMCDIEELNKLACSAEIDVCKISYGVYDLIAENFKILNSGSALGRGNGPLLVSRHRMYKDEIKGVRVAVPGLNTTANMLMTSLFGDSYERKAYLFSDIADVVLSDECDAGVLIHEGRFTYQDKGLSLVADLGELWQQKTNLPLPLGAIAVNRSLSEAVQQKIDRVLRRSIEFAMADPKASYNFVKHHARELSDEVLDSHIALFVNEFSVDLGEDGRNAVLGLLSGYDSSIFVSR